MPGYSLRVFAVSALLREISLVSFRKPLRAKEGNRNAKHRGKAAYALLLLLLHRIGFISCRLSSQVISPTLILAHPALSRGDMVVSLRVDPPYCAISQDLAAMETA
ncbi:hypothetical protein BS47DRAFT_1393113 [Hydnum rufescens UP504]|uniref:Uncharacterized protein n=1 Tax=Hydnum rufescens UP504 TaxID=1448309 RepID=A0A9P6AXW2_9AGAM|nr:hypothetical protein BS47DRAFT_1393113 [Hydnum rufescens UP504]